MEQERTRLRIRKIKAVGVVDSGASVGAEILFVKRDGTAAKEKGDPHMEAIVKSALMAASVEPDLLDRGTARQVIWRAITKLAKADYPGMNASEGRITLVSTPAGRELVELSSDPDAAKMSFVDFLEKKIVEKRAIEGAESVTNTFGESGGTIAGLARAEIQKRADELRKQDPTLTLSEARVKVFESDPALRTRYEEERAA